MNESCVVCFTGMWEQTGVRLIAMGSSVFQLGALISFYMSLAVPISISRVVACDETACVLFTCVFSLFGFVQLLSATFYFVCSAEKGGEIQQTGVETVLTASWTFALTLRYPVGTHLHYAFAGVFLGSYMLVLLLQQYQGAGGSVTSVVVFLLWITAGCLLIAWVCTQNDTLEWVAWGLITLVQVLLNSPLWPRCERPQVWQLTSC